MGQKVNPIGYRLGVNKDWQSKWYKNRNEFGNINEPLGNTDS